MISHAAGELTRLFADKLHSEYKSQKPADDGSMRIRHSDLLKCAVLLREQQDDIDDLSLKLSQLTTKTT